MTRQATDRLCRTDRTRRAARARPKSGWCCSATSRPHVRGMRCCCQGHPSPAHWRRVPGLERIGQRLKRIDHRLAHLRLLGLQLASRGDDTGTPIDDRKLIERIVRIVPGGAAGGNQVKLHWAASCGHIQMTLHCCIGSRGHPVSNRRVARLGYRSPPMHDG